jgi:hypothetical protein
MVISHAALISTLSFAPLLLHGQAGLPAAPPAPPAAPVVPSTLLQPALTLVESTLNSLKIDKWKRGSVRDEAGQNAQTMLSDMKSKLPPLIADADAAPGALSKSIPLVKHIDALYDVLLRIEEASRVAAPNDQIDQLAAALKKFGSARNDLYDSLQRSSEGQEKHVTDLQATIKAQEEAAREAKAATPPAPVPCTPPPKPAAKKKRTAPAKNPQAAPATGTQTPPAGNTQTTPPAQPKTPQ